MGRASAGSGPFQSQLAVWLSPRRSKGSLASRPCTEAERWDERGLREPICPEEGSNAGKHILCQNLLKLLRLLSGPTRDGLFLLGPSKTVKYFSVSQVAHDASFMEPTRRSGGGFFHFGQ